jgi:glyoxylase-like metal-dependent hydrolase (beta-lactamase superfamily II)
MSTPQTPQPVPDGHFVEVADRCWVARHELLDVNVGVVGGERGLLVIDTHTSEPAARGVVERVRGLGAGQVVAVVNTHAHFDHYFGNVVFAEEYDGLVIHAHEDAAAAMVDGGPAVQETARHDDDPDAGQIAQTRLRLPDRTFSSAMAIDLGDRFVELFHPGRGHTGGDAVVRVPETDVLFAGDLVEESALRNGVPGFGDDCFPLEWPFTLDLLISMLTGDSVVVPGHGLPVGREFVSEQRGSIGMVAEQIRELAGNGVPAAEALSAGSWPYPAEELGQAVARGYDQLPRSARTLPLA